MIRRRFLQLSALSFAGMGLKACNEDASRSQSGSHILDDASLTIDGVHLRYRVPQVTQPVKIIQITDTHLWRDDERGEPYRQYSNRMARAYNQTRHFQTGDLTNPEESFEQVLQMAQEKEADLVALTGDNFSFPSEAAVEWAMERLEQSGLEWMFTSGNHDWPYEGMPGSIHELRDTWIEKRLMDLYRGTDPMNTEFRIKEISIVGIDNATYDISDSQLAFFRNQVQQNRPMLLMMHIPLYAPGRSVWHGCGHPEWGAHSDPVYELEGREPWAVEGHSETTFSFRKEAFQAPNMLGVFVGHRHRYTTDMVHRTPQFVAPPNANGGYLEIDILPMTV